MRGCKVTLSAAAIAVFGLTATVSVAAPHTAPLSDMPARPAQMPRTYAIAKTLAERLADMALRWDREKNDPSQICKAIGELAEVETQHRKLIAFSGYPPSLPRPDNRSRDELRKRAQAHGLNCGR